MSFPHSLAKVRDLRFLAALEMTNRGRQRNFPIATRYPTEEFEKGNPYNPRRLYGISIPFWTAGRAEILSNQRFTFGKSSSLTW
jgi:hypothetical protein